MSDAPVVTALMPVRTYRDGYLREAVDSLLAQTNPAWGLLIVADGPSPRALRRALDGRADDARVDVIENERRRLAAALNTGMRHASTEFVSVLFADDTWEPRAVEVLARAIEEHPDVDLFHSSRRVVADDGSAISDVLPAKADVTVADFGPESPICHLMCWRRETGLAVGGMDESLASVGPDDYDFPWTMAENGAVIRALPECLYVIRDHRSHPRLTTHLPRSVHEDGMRRIMLKHGMDPLEVERFIRAARKGFLRQCLYRSRPERWLRRLVGIRPRVWRETYR